MSEAGLKVKIQLLKTEKENRGLHAKLPFYTRTHARTHTYEQAHPPQVHLSPAWRPRGRGGKAKALVRRAAQLAEDTRGQQGQGSCALSGQDHFPEPLPVCYPHHYPPAPSRRLHRERPGPAAPRPRSGCSRPDALSKCGPCRISAKLQSGGGGCPEKRWRNPRPARRALTPPGPLVLKPVPRAAHPRAPPKLHTHRALEPRRQGPRVAAVIFRSSEN